MSDREAQRAADRERRAQERIAAAEARTARRQEEREAGMRSREQAREARRIEEEQRRSARVEGRVEERDARPRRRASTGALARTGEARVERDVRGYTTNVDHARMVELARRGATVAGLATVFGVTEDAVRAVLAEAEDA
ncbi:MAG: hypothetical protein PGN23_16550 [Sphingomonas adhaesiva]|uniref:hypothetical protein n=1 Tax=Sphingomonas adhaesiva TaxID=28212 RepID=UPI002FFAC2DA